MTWRNPGNGALSGGGLRTIHGRQEPTTVVSSVLYRVGVTIAGILLLSHAYAGDESSGALSFEIQADRIISGERVFTDTHIDIESSLTVAVARRITLNTGLAFEEVDPVDGESTRSRGSRFLANSGLYVQRLYLEWSDDAWSVHAGKFAPAFGLAWDSELGLYGDDFAGDYEITEQLGAGIIVPLAGDDEGAVALSFDAFMVDSSKLASCLVTECVRPRRSDGGAGNTAWPNSFSVTLGASTLPALGGLGFQAGILRRGGGDGDPNDELGFALALTHAFELDGGSAVEWTFEGARMNHFEAGTDNVTFVTAGLTWQRDRWNVAIAGAMRNTDSQQGEETRDTLIQLSARYAFESGYSVEIGWRGGEGDGTDQTIGAVVAYDVEF